MNNLRPAHTGKRTLAFAINMLPVTIVLGFIDAYTLDHAFFSELAILGLIVLASFIKWSPGGAMMKLYILTGEGNNVGVVKRVLRMAPFILFLLFAILADGIRFTNFNLHEETKLVLHFAMKILIGAFLVNFAYVLYDADERTLIDRILGIGVYSKADVLTENFSNGKIRTSRWW